MAVKAGTDAPTFSRLSCREPAGGLRRPEVVGRFPERRRDRREWGRQDPKRARLLAALAQTLAAIRGALIALIARAIGKAAGARADRILLAALLREERTRSADDAADNKDNPCQRTESRITDSMFH